MEKRKFESICRLVLVYNKINMFLSLKNPLEEGFYCQFKIWIFFKKGGLGHRYVTLLNNF